MKPGYKQTEVGVIPEDWEVVRLGDVGEALIGLTYSPDQVVDAPGFLVLRSSNIQNGRIDLQDEVFVNAEFPDRLFVRPGDLLICARNGSRDLIGKCARIAEPMPRTTFGAFMAVLRSRHGEFLSFAFGANCVQRQVREHLGATINQITNKSLLGFWVALPPNDHEQRAIAEALSDADALIESLEALIAKKRQIKQGAMQELLTGKRRLPGFSGEWETRLLGQLADIRSGGTPATGRSEFWDGGVPWCTPTDITRLAGKYLATTERTISALGLSSSSAELLPVGTVVMTSRATIGECALTRVPLATNQGFKNFVCGTSCDAEFLYYRLHTETAGFIRLCGGSTFLEIGKRQLVEYPVEIPPSVSEQRAIAAVLSDLDSELEALETKLEKARAIKQGMMQELLTGRTRLVPAEVS